MCDEVVLLGHRHNLPAIGFYKLGRLAVRAGLVSGDTWQVEESCNKGELKKVHMYRKLLQACMEEKALGQVKQVHARVAEEGLELNRYLSDLLVTSLVKCGSFEDGLKLFRRLPHRTVFSWTAIMSGYCSAGRCREVLECFRQMQQEGVKPNKYTLVRLLQACSRLGELDEGRKIHAHCLRHSVEADVYVGSALVSMYAKCGSIEDARQVFNRLLDRSVVTWNAMIASYAQQEQGEDALEMYALMQSSGVKPDARTFVSVLQACGSLAEKEECAMVEGQLVKMESLRKGKEVHAEAARRGFEWDVFVGSILVSMYAKCGSSMDAEQVFERLPDRNVVSWTAMIAACAQQKQADKAFHLFALMREGNVQPDEATFISLFQACGNAGALRMCRQAHQSLAKDGSFQPSLRVSNCLIHAYARCGSMADARSVFDALPQPDVVSWNALIAGYSRQGDCESSMLGFEEMRSAGVKPSVVTFLVLLSACTHAGKVEEGLRFFESMSRAYGMSPVVEHYVCVLDLVARAGLLGKAQDLILSMPTNPTAQVWLCLLSACRKHDNLLLARRAFDRAVAQDPGQAASYVVMSNMYARAGMWNHAEEIDGSRQRAGAWKKPGESWIEHEQQVHTFVVGDRMHQDMAALYALLHTISSKLRV